MDEADEKANRGWPLLRVTTFGEFTIERLVPSPPHIQVPHYVHLPWEDVNSRSTALTMLKILLCRSGRRASKEELIAAIWDSHQEAINTAHILDTAASLLRRHILRTYSGESLLITLKGGGETSFKLPPQHYLWVDADALLASSSQATEVEQEGRDPLPYLEAAHTLVRGEFLDEDLDAKWSQGKRLVVNGARHRVLYRLVELYVGKQQMNRAEELLFNFLVDNPTDEDALCQLMLLLAEKERRHEALNIYRYVANILHDEKREPATYTQSLVNQIQHGLSLQEDSATYSTLNANDLLIFPLVIQVERRLARNLV
ncbi:MAG: winged helix-turn-helix domain-containing protein, partial [Ktedonobacteraceae bacterium]|nr:winged helix-turn-helix domain-containing protein [Ktedonobacteraceae bacterium]